VEKLKAIISATNQMTRLVEDLLFLARTDTIGSNSITPTQEWIAIPLKDLLEDVAELLEPQAQLKDISLNYDRLTQLTIMGDPSQLFRLFSNLLENALQYTLLRGEVKLSLENINQFLMVTIEDSGIGIAPEDLPFIFQRLWRSDQARSCRSKGSGLGLAIAQAIAITHGGKITVKSQLGLGTSFYVFLPTRIDP
jgi:signal transduction histidine kinase